MEAGVRRRGTETPPGVALTGHTPPVCPGGRPPCVARAPSDVLLPELPTEELPCHGEMLAATTEIPQEIPQEMAQEIPQEMAAAEVPQEMPLATAEVPQEMAAAKIPQEMPSAMAEVPQEMPSATTEVLQEMSAAAQVPQEMPSATAKLPAKALPSAVPPAKAGKDPCLVKLPPCPEKWETCPGEVPPIAVPVLPTSLQVPAEQPSQLVPRGRCLIHNWQEERATNHLDLVPGQELGSEGFIHRHGHHGLLAHQPLSWPTNSTTMKDAYRPPHRVLLLGRGQREAMLEAMLYQKYRKEMLEEICPPQTPVESVSTTHQDYRTRCCQFTPLPAIQPHNYCTEQPCSFWLEQARSLPGVTSIRSGDSPFRRNAAFSTPITEYLEQPLPRATLSSWLQPLKQ